MTQEYRTVNTLSELAEALLKGETKIKINFEDCSFLYPELLRRGVDLCDIDITEWDVSGVTDMGGMFYRAEKFNQPIGNWDVSKVTHMHGMFMYAEKFNQPIGNWDVSSVTDMYAMFQYVVNFNQPLGNWDVSNVINMNFMFYHAKNFNQPIGNWDVSTVTNTLQVCHMFRDCPINNSNKPKGIE